MLEQGLDLSRLPAEAAQPLPAPLKKPDDLPTGAAQPHVFVVMANPTGQRTKVRRRVFTTPQPPAPVPILPAPLSQTTTPSQTTAPSQTTTLTATTISPQVPYSTTSYRKRKLQDETAGIFKRTYKKTAEFVKCKECRGDRGSDSHKQYYGNYHCAVTHPDPTHYENWRAEMQNKYRNKKKK